MQMDLSLRRVLQLQALISLLATSAQLALSLFHCRATFVWSAGKLAFQMKQEAVFQVAL